MNTHTPGDWEVYEVHDGNAVIARGIKSSGGGLNHGDTAELFTEADARMMASAPELLAALENMLNTFGHVPDKPGKAGFGQPAVSFAKRVVAKAKGESR